MGSWKKENNISNLIDAEVTNQYVDIIRDRLGIILKPDDYHLITTIQNACTKFKYTPEEYLKKLNNSSNDSMYFEHLIAGVTIGETYFFRDKKQMQVLYEHILPKIIKSKRDESNLVIRIWSAGCSSGEEIYTIAMMLDELIIDKSKWQLHLLGSDINVSSLKKALKGEYSEWSMRSIPEKYKKNYFTKINRSYKIIDTAKKYVSFDYINLTDDVYPSINNNTSTQDLILCRNVLIYFDNDHIQLLMKRISKCLVPDGYLLLGSSDPIELNCTSLSRCKELPSLCVNKAITVLPKQTEAISSVILTKQITGERPVEKASKSIDDLITDLMNESRWPEVIKQIELLGNESEKNAFLLTSKATALANLGMTNDAISACEKSLRIDKTNPWTYFVLALSHGENDDTVAAESAFRKSLFLDRKFTICYFQFGLFLIRHNRIDEGYKLLNNAMKIASDCKHDQIVPYANGLTYKRMSEILDHEIDLYKGVVHQQ